MKKYTIEIVMELIEKNPKLKDIGVYDVMGLVQEVLKAQKIVDEKMKSKCH